MGKARPAGTIGLVGIVSGRFVHGIGELWLGIRRRLPKSCGFHVRGDARHKSVRVILPFIGSTSFKATRVRETIIPHRWRRL